MTAIYFLAAVGGLCMAAVGLVLAYAAFDTEEPENVCRFCGQELGKDHEYTRGE